MHKQLLIQCYSEVEIILSVRRLKLFSCCLCGTIAVWDASNPVVNFALALHEHSDKNNQLKG